VTAVRGDKAKKSFFTNPNFGIKEGYVLLHPSIPNESKLAPKTSATLGSVQEVDAFVKMTIALFNRDRFGDGEYLAFSINCSYH
jgi:hypothetical protein